jgi:uncharacterized membrane protein YcaP (DUF421 family)
VFSPGIEWWEVIARTAIVYAALVLGFRLFGKREIGQMTPFDLVVILLIANAVQNAMVGTDSSVTGGLIAAATLLAANYVIAYARRKSGRFRQAIEGDPSVLISDGEVNDRVLRREGLDVDDVLQAIREHGVDGVRSVRLAVLEVDGTISIVPNDAASTIRTKRRYRQRSHQN